MNDNKTNIEEIKKKVADFIKERDWEQFHHPKELAISINLEASELLEIFQWKEKLPLQEIKKDEQTLKRLKEELADILIYCTSLSNQLGLDISQIILDKLEKNNQKYPIKKFKGSAKKYNELEQNGI